MKKKPIAAALLIIVLLTACADSTGSSGADDRDKISIVATTFPIYDWMKEIIGEDNPDIALTLLLDNGTDLHSYEPTISDITDIAGCDMFIHVGGVSDAWIKDVLKTNTNSNMVSISLLELIADRVKEEELVEGMTQEPGYEHGEEEPDEHVWLSIKNAEAACRGLGEKLRLIDSKSGASIESNLKAYVSKLSELDSRYESLISDAEYDTLVFCDRFPFRYLVDDYNLNYFAPFAGCSTETEASFETITLLSSKVDELGLKNVMVIETSDQSIAKTVIANTQRKDQEILVLNSMQSVTADELASGISYLSVMEKNLNVLTQALS